MSASESVPERRWIEVRVRAPGAGDADVMVAEGLIALGGRAVEERDGWFLTHLREPGDGSASLTETMDDVRDRLGALTGFPALEVEAQWRANEDWAETWRRGLAPRRLTERIVVRPSWTEIPDPRPGDLVITLDPGMAFGTAEHGTTRGCLRLLDRAVTPGDRVLDVGSGSGILAIGAALLGAASVLAVESDPLALEALDENVERNGVADRVRWSELLADVPWLEGAGPVSGVVANIESGILGPLLPGFQAALEPGGWLILSGILDHEWPGMQAATEARGFRLIDVDADGEWRSGLFRAGEGPRSRA